MCRKPDTARMSNDSSRTTRMRNGPRTAPATAVEMPATVTDWLTDDLTQANFVEPDGGTSFISLTANDRSVMVSGSDTSPVLEFASAVHECGADPSLSVKSTIGRCPRLGE